MGTKKAGAVGAAPGRWWIGVVSLAAAAALKEMCCKIAKTAAFIVAALLQLLVNGPVHCDADAMW
jgi:hypothetical protein